MCGLLGAFGPQYEDLSKNLPKALTCISYRGPDDSGTVTLKDHQIILGHQRLAILDLSQAGHQPMAIDDDWLVFNGEIYNHQSLRKTHLGKHLFRSSSDTETLLLLLREYGPSILNEIKGMFAAAWYNAKSEELTLFRDSLGIKPLFYYQLPDSTLCFSSEVKGIIALTAKNPAINTSALNSYLATENYPAESSLFEGVHSLHPGEVKVFKNLNKSITETSKNTFRPLTENTQISDDDHKLAEVIENAIVRSVKMHLLADVPVGVYLSGGIDSSLVATIAAKHTTNVLGFTGYFQTQDQHYDERPLARKVAAHAGIELKEIEITPDDFTNNFDSLIYHLDQPRMGMGSFSQFVVAKTAAKHRKVILAGHGGDELFAGYPLHKATWLNSKKLNFESISTLKSLNAKEWPWILYSFLQKSRGKPLRFTPEIWQGRLNFNYPECAFSSSSPDPLRDLDLYYKNMYIPGLLEVEDRISMAHSLETRVPLWSQDLVQLASQIPISRKIKNGQLKYLLKLVANNWLPQEVLNAPKRGFPTPLRLWFRHELKSFVESRLLNSQYPNFYQIISKDDLASLIYSHQNSPRPFALDELRAHKIWTALCLESWLGHYIKRMKR